MQTELKRRRGRKSRIDSALESLTAEEASRIAAVLDGSAMVIRINFVQYSLQRVEDAWLFYCFSTGISHTVLGDACSCEDFRFRHNRCKHLRALDAIKV